MKVNHTDTEAEIELSNMEMLVLKSMLQNCKEYYFKELDKSFDGKTPIINPDEIKRIYNNLEENL